MINSRKPYPSDVSDEDWALVVPYLTLLPEESGQRTHSRREVFNSLRYIIKTGAPCAGYSMIRHLGRSSISKPTPAAGRLLRGPGGRPAPALAKTLGRRKILRMRDPVPKTCQRL